MYVFACKPSSLRVILHDSSGQRIGEAQFTDGSWQTAAPALAEAMLAAAAACREFGICPVVLIAADPEPAAVAAEAAPVAPAASPEADTPPPAKRRRRRH